MMTMNAVGVVVISGIKDISKSNNCCLDYTSISFIVHHFYVVIISSSIGVRDVVGGGGRTDIIIIIVVGK